MSVLNVIAGLIGLGIVIFVHELGHFLAARSVGIGVDAFSLGWGPRIAGFRKGETDYRISAFPIGGYCLMKGENEFRAALENKKEDVPRDPGTFYGASPWRRIVVSLAGPAANVVFAALVFAIVALVGYSVPTESNRIVLASEYPSEPSAAHRTYPADRAGLLSGDSITSMGGKRIRDYFDIQETIAENLPGGKIGVLPWIEPVISTVAAGSAAALSGLQSGDRIVSVDGKAVMHSAGFYSLLAGRPERIVLGISRGTERLDLPLVLSWKDNGASDPGIAFGSIPHRVHSSGFLASIGDGWRETAKTISLTFRSLTVLVRHPAEKKVELIAERGAATVHLSISPSLEGVNLLNSLSGPARITWIVGSSAVQGFADEGLSGLARTFDFLAFLSIGLFIMNLLPIPALDGGQVILFLVEGLRRRPMKLLTIYRFQVTGAIVIFTIFIVATVGDFMFFAR